MVWTVWTFFAIFGCARGQFQLILNTPGQPTPVPVGPGRFDPNCKDKIPNCKQFGQTSCKAPYDGWAKENCANSCKFCIGPTDPPPPCKDTITDCDQYDKSVCNNPTYQTWANEKCRYYCRKCPPAELARMDALTTTVPPVACKDKLDCRLYGKAVCDVKYQHWAKENCMNYCGICTGVPTPPTACADTIPNCAAYDKSTCADVSFKLWVQDHCRQHCGLCGGGSPTAHPPMIIPTVRGPVIRTPPMPGK